MRSTITRHLLAALAVVLSCGAALAQTVPSPQTNQTQTFVAFTQTARAPDIAASSSSQDVTLGALAPVVIFYNLGSSWAYVGLATAASTVTATGGVPVGPGACVALNSTKMTHAQAISAGGTTLQIALGSGSPGQCDSNSAGGASVPTPSASSSAAVPYSTSGGTALVNSRTLKTTAGNFYSFAVTVNTTVAAATWALFVFDSATATGTLMKCYNMPTGSRTFTGAFPTPVRFGTGLTIAVSTADCGSTYAAPGAVGAFISGEVL